MVAGGGGCCGLEAFLRVVVGLPAEESMVREEGKLEAEAGETLSL